MGKIGDLWVRLGLKSDDYKKGIDKAQSETKKFSGGLDKLKAGAVAVWAAIGTAVVAFGKEMLKTTNAIGDAWQMFTAQATAGWKTFVQAVSNFDFNGFIGKFKEATAAARELQSALDYEFEVSNSIKVQKSLIAEELEELRIAARDQTKSMKERLAATEEYMRKITPLYEQEIQLANELLDAQQGKWLAGSGLKDNQQTRADLMKFIVDYGKDRQLAKAIAQMRDMQSDYDLAVSTRFRSGNFTTPNKLIDEYRALRDYVKNFGEQNGYGTDIYALANIYEDWRGDEDTMPLVDAIVNAGNAQAALNKETRQIQTLQNSILAQLEEVHNPVQELLEQARADIEAATEEDMRLLDKVNDLRMQMSLEELPKMSEDTQKAIDALAAPDIFSDTWLQGQKDNLDELKAKMAELGLGIRAESQETAEQVTADAATAGGKTAEMTFDLSSVLQSSVINGIQALTDSMFDLDGATMERTMYAFIQPLAEAMKSMGAMIMSAGSAMAALKISPMQPAAAVAAGAALIAAGSLISSGLSAMVGGASGRGSGTHSSYGGSSYANTDNLNYESTLTVYVEGRLSGSDILLAGKRTQDKLRR